MRKSVSIFLQILLCFFILVLLFLLSYVIGFQYLQGNNLSGNDSYSFLSVALWVAKYFPKVPFWYPLTGGGVSLTSGYPVFAAYLISIISKVSSLDVVQSFRLLGFLSVPLLAFGVFVFTWFRLKSIENILLRQLIGIIASIFVVTSPASWIWLTRWGFYAESVSCIFVPWTILFFDIFLEKVLENKKDLGFRIGFIGTLIFLTLSLITHFFAAASLIVFFGVVTIVRYLSLKEKSFFLLKKIIVSFIGLGIVFLALSIFRLYPYLRYSKEVSFGGFSGYGVRAYQELLNNTVPLKMMLSLDKPETIMDPHALIFDMRFPFYVWLFFIVGFIFSFKNSKKVFSFSVYGFLGLLFSTLLSVKFAISKIPIIGSIIGLMEDRGYLIVARLVVPLVSAYGAYIIWEVIFGWIYKKIVKIDKKTFINWLLKSFKEGLVAILTLLSVFVGVISFYQKPYNVPFLIGTGAFSGTLDLRDIWVKKPYISQFLYSSEIDFITNNPEYAVADFRYMHDICLIMPMDIIKEGTICDKYLKDKDLIFPPIDLVKNSERICKENNQLLTDPSLKYCDAFYSGTLEQLKFKNWPAFSISSDIFIKDKELKELFSGLPNKEYRYDLSGFVGINIMATPLYTQNSMIQLYINTLSLIHNSWNYQSQVMYTNSPLSQKPGVLSEIAKWFGLNYVYLFGTDLEPSGYWDTDSNWSSIGNWKVFSKNVSLTSWTQKPKVLVVTDTKRGLYDQAFRFFTWGGLTYDMGIPIIGKREIDSYSLEELQSYDFILMRGYKYKSKSKAYKLLDNYVRGGGKLIFDTGWQFEVPDYEIESAPDFMPFNSLSWKNLSLNSSYEILDSDFSENVDINNFGPLDYGTGSWGVSVPGSLRSWAKPILSYDDESLVVSGDYGKGKVIWIGFNIIAHATAKDSLNEAYFFSNLVKYLANNNSNTEMDITYKRINPDRIEFTLNTSNPSNSSLYFREAYFPYWKAKLISENGKTVKNLKIERAGPGFMLINLPKVSVGDKVVLTIQTPFWFYKVLSLITGLVLILYLFIPSFFLEVGKLIKLPKLLIKDELQKTTRKKIFIKSFKLFNDDEEKNY